MSEIGATLAAEHQGKGYAREALERLLEHLFEDLGLHRVRASADVENHAAWHLMVQLGLRSAPPPLQAVSTSATSATSTGMPAPRRMSRPSSGAVFDCY